MKEEDNILRKVGTGNPFQVPDGYFENFTSEVMQRLPEKEKPAFVMKEPTLWDKVKPWIYMAAMFAGAALIIRVASDDRQKAAVAEQLAGEMVDMEELSDEDISLAVDNTMLDDYSLYVYLADSETNGISTDAE